MTSFTFIDLFAGIGGFRCALTALGGQHLFANEWDKDSATTYKNWYGDHNVSTEDFRLILPSDVPKHDVLAAGFPCQPFSIAGVSKKNSLGRPHGFDDLEQGNLFEFLAKLMDTNRPSVFILENVKNLLSHDKKNTFKQIASRLDSIDYSWGYKVLSSETFVPQRRQRIFIVGFDKRVFGVNAIDNFAFPSYEGKPKKLKSILEKEPDPKYMLSDNLWQFLQAYKAKHSALGNGFGFKTFSAEDTARTISARYYKDGADILINQPGWKNPRKLTPKEALKLMGFTPKYASLFKETIKGNRGFPQVVSDAKTYKQCGNAVVPDVVESVMRQVVIAVEAMGGFPSTRH